jgi:hypothetical protein
LGSGWKFAKETQCPRLEVVKFRHQRASYSTRDFETKHILGIDISIPGIT